MKCVAFSDTHGRHNKSDVLNQSGDVLIFAGDMCRRGKSQEVVAFLDWLRKLASRFRHIVVVPGNHDKPIEMDKQTYRRLFASAGIHLLLHDAVVLDGVPFFGSPYTPTFGEWSFMRDRGPSIQRMWETIHNDTQVLITHGPPHGIGDRVPANSRHLPLHVGCYDLLTRVYEVRPKVHVFGHVHAGFGVYTSDAIPETRFFNAALCDEDYYPSNRSMVFHLS